jgi:hypothetical protein
MSEDEMLKCLICFVLGFLVHRMMRGNGLMVGGQAIDIAGSDLDDFQNYLNNNYTANLDSDTGKMITIVANNC